MSVTSPLAHWLAAHIPLGSRVLDLGCGNGDLLAHLQTHNRITGYGIDIEFDNIKTCIQRGLAAYQGDIDEGLQEFGDQRFDYVILSQTLQQVKHPTRVLHEMLRVGQYGMVTFPNFAYWRNRWHLLQGVTPVTDALPYRWDNTPNIRVITLRDFQSMCQREGFQMRMLQPDGTTRSMGWRDNWQCEYGICCLSKGIAS